MTRARRIGGFAACGLAGAIALGIGAARVDRPPGEPARAQRNVASAAPVMAREPLPAGPAREPHSAPGRSTDAIEHAIFTDGSLRGTDFPGWGVARDQHLQPTAALRERFDHYLLAIGEASVDELGRLLNAHALRDLGPATAAEVMAVWQRYLALQRHRFLIAAKLDDLASLQNALQERRQVRQSLLGLDWARAFYGDEERSLAADIERAQQGIAPTPDALQAALQPPAGADARAVQAERVARFGAERAERLREIDAEHAAWEERIERTRVQLQALRQQPALSAPQREQAITSHLDAEFGQGSERRRAVALLGL